MSNEDERYVRITLVHEYIVPADDLMAMGFAKETLYEELVQCKGGDNWFNAIVSEDAPDATADDVPEFIREFIEEHKE